MLGRIEPLISSPEHVRPFQGSQRSMGTLKWKSTTLWESPASRHLEDAGLHVESGIHHSSSQQTHRPVASLCGWQLPRAVGEPHLRWKVHIFDKADQSFLDQRSQQRIQQSIPLLLFRVYEIPCRFQNQIFFDLVQLQLKLTKCCFKHQYQPSTYSCGAFSWRLERHGNHVRALMKPSTRVESKPHHPSSRTVSE